jgi:hypothetical protein
MARSGFKMKGNPMQRNFGISPMQSRETVELYASGEKEVVVKGDERSSAELISLSKRARKDGNTKAADLMLAKANKKISEKKAAQDYLDTNA